MMEGFKIAIYIIFFICLGADIFFIIRLSYYYRYDKTDTVRAYLKSTKHQRNVYKGGKHGEWYKHRTDFTCTYRVDGVGYELSGDAPWIPSKLPRYFTVVYQRKHPKRAYIKGYTSPDALIGVIAMSAFSVMFLAASILALLDI